MPHAIRRCILIALAFALSAQTASGWIYPEHRRILLLAIQRLPPAERKILDRIWASARKDFSGRLTESVIDSAQGIKPSKIDYAAWAAIAGDHSCSPQDMLNNILRSDWILRVADIAARLQIDIEKSVRRSQHVNAIRDSDIKLQRADQDYATRAGSSNVHFLLARPAVDTTPIEYLTSCLKGGTELNAIGAYSWFHTSALVKAARCASENLTAENRQALMLAALADEAFALHFLQDVYAAGHMAGTWGEAPVRKGTHDFYNEKGLEIVTWDGKRFISLGDAYMRGEDEEIASENVLASLEQFLKVVSGGLILDYGRTPFASLNIADTFNICRNNFTPQYNAPTGPSDGKVSIAELLKQILVKTPVPGLATGLGEIPRFRSELGMFIGISGALNGATTQGGFGSLQTEHAVVGGIEANVRFGLGLDGVLNQAGDGLLFIQLGVRQDAASTTQFQDSYGSVPPGLITAAIPGRGAYNVRLRLPFWLIPGDLLVAGPILMLTSKRTLTRMAVTAANGGVIPWQSGIATRIGRFQFVAGREVGISLYGKIPQDDQVLIPNPGAPATLVKYSSVKLDFPILEYRPFREFSLKQSSDIMIQFSTGVDIPRSEGVIIPAGDPAPELRPVWYFGVRLIFDWRHYF